MTNNWDEYRELVLRDLERLNEIAARREDDFTELRDSIAQLRGDIKAMREKGAWETRILTAFWGLVLTCITYVLNRHP